MCVVARRCRHRCCSCRCSNCRDRRANEQCPTEFFVGESRCATQISISLAFVSSQPDFLLRCTIPFYSLHFVASDSHFHLIAASIPGPYSCTCARVSYDHHHRHHACHPYVITLLSRPRMSRQGQHISYECWPQCPWNRNPFTSKSLDLISTVVADQNTVVCTVRLYPLK